jgi:hypothetical protein
MHCARGSRRGLRRRPRSMQRIGVQPPQGVRKAALVALVAAAKCGDAAEPEADSGGTAAATRVGVGADAKAESGSTVAAAGVAASVDASGVSTQSQVPAGEAVAEQREPCTPTREKQAAKRKRGRERAAPSAPNAPLAPSTPKRGRIAAATAEETPDSKAAKGRGRRRGASAASRGTASGAAPDTNACADGAAP